MLNRRVGLIVEAMRAGKCDLPNVLVVGAPAMSDAVAIALHREALRPPLNMVPVPGAGEASAMMVRGGGSGGDREDGDGGSGNSEKYTELRSWLRSTPACIDGRRRAALALRVSDLPSSVQGCLKGCCEGGGSTVFWVMSAACASRVSASIKSMCMVVGAEPEDPLAFAKRVKPGLPDCAWDFLVRGSRRSVAECIGSGGPAGALARQLTSAFKNYSMQGGDARGVRVLREASLSAVASGLPSPIVGSCIMIAAARVFPGDNNVLRAASVAAARADSEVLAAKRTVILPALYEAAFNDVMAATGTKARAAETVADVSSAAAAGRATLAALFAKKPGVPPAAPPPASKKKAAAGGGKMQGGQQGTLDCWMSVKKI